MKHRKKFDRFDFSMTFKFTNLLFQNNFHNKELLLRRLPILFVAILTPRHLASLKRLLHIPWRRKGLLTSNVIQISKFIQIWSGDWVIFRHMLDLNRTVIKLLNTMTSLKDSRDEIYKLFFTQPTVPLTAFWCWWDAVNLHLHKLSSSNLA